MTSPASTQALSNAKGFLLGIPYDGTSGRQPLQRYGPTLLRRALENLDPDLSATLYDAGDVLTEPLAFTPTNKRVRETIHHLQARAPDALPILLGGEHTVSLSTVHALTPASIISLDAHPDLWEDQHGKAIAHGTWLKRAIEDLQIPAVLPMARAARGAEQAAIEALDIHTHLPDTLPEPVYLSIDIDVFDPTDAPSVVFPEPDGPDASRVLELIETIASRFELAGLDIVEVNANRMGPTARLGARCLQTAVHLRNQQRIPTRDEAS